MSTPSDWRCSTPSWIGPTGWNLSTFRPPSSSGVIANDPLPTGPHIPFGGYKESGMGRENGSHGIEDFLEVKAISIGI